MRLWWPVSSTAFSASPSSAVLAGHLVLTSAALTWPENAAVASAMAPNRDLKLRAETILDMSGKLTGILRRTRDFLRAGVAISWDAGGPGRFHESGGIRLF